MDSLWLTVLFVYLIVAVMDYLWMMKVDDSRGEKQSVTREVVTVIESALWPIILPLEIIFLIIVTVFELVLYLILMLNNFIKAVIGRYNGH